MERPGNCEELQIGTRSFHLSCDKALHICNAEGKRALPDLPAPTLLESMQKIEGERSGVRQMLPVQFQLCAPAARAPKFYKSCGKTQFAFLSPIISTCMS